MIAISNILIAIYIFGFKVHKKIVHWLISGLANTQLLFEAFWMSVLSKKTILSIDNYSYSHSKKYFTKTFNTSFLYEWEPEMIDRFFSQCKTIMVLGSGGGREMYAFLKKGLYVDGYECNDKFVKYSKQFFIEENLNTNIEWVAPNHCPDNNKIYDGIWLGWGVYNHVRGKAQRINLLKEINTHLLSGSPVLISFWHANEAMDPYCRKLTKINHFFCKIFRTKPIENGDRLAPFSGHFFLLADVAEELKEAEFSVVYLKSQPYGHIIAHKI